MQAERFRLARLASVGRREEKLNNSIKAKLHIVDVVVVVGFVPCFSSTIENICIFLPEDSLSRISTRRQSGGVGIQHLLRPLPGSGGDCHVCQKMMVGNGRSQHRGLVPAVLSPPHAPSS